MWKWIYFTNGNLKVQWIQFVNMSIETEPTCQYRNLYYLKTNQFKAKITGKACQSYDKIIFQ